MGAPAGERARGPHKKGALQRTPQAGPACPRGGYARRRPPAERARLGNFRRRITLTRSECAAVAVVL